MQLLTCIFISTSATARFLGHLWEYFTCHSQVPTHRPTKEYSRAECAPCVCVLGSHQRRGCKTLTGQPHPSSHLCTRGAPHSWGRPHLMPVLLSCLLCTQFCLYFYVSIFIHLIFLSDKALVFLLLLIPYLYFFLIRLCNGVGHFFFIKASCTPFPKAHFIPRIRPHLGLRGRGWGPLCLTLHPHPQGGCQDCQPHRPGHSSLKLGTGPSTLLAERTLRTDSRENEPSQRPSVR